MRQLRPGRVDGLPLITSGQLAFPSVQQASADANTLDDYEEGTWTPTIGGSGGQSGQTYTGQSGQYVKIGQLVVASFALTLSAKGTITTSVQIQGLPFAAQTVTSQFVAQAMYDSLATNWVEVTYKITSGGTVADVWGQAAAGVSNLATKLAQADLNDNARFEGVFVYRAAA